MELETLVDDLEEVTLEATESVQEVPELTILPTDSSEIYIDSISVEAPVVMAAPNALVNTAVTFSKDNNVYRLDCSGSVYTVLFPEDAHIAVMNGTLVNLGSSNITGVVLNGYNIDLSTFSDRYLTLMPITQSSSNTNRYRYHAAAYITKYSVSTSTNLTTTTEYVSINVLDKPNIGFGLGLETYIIAGLLLILVITNFIGGIFRR